MPLNPEDTLVSKQKKAEAVKERITCNTVPLGNFGAILYPLAPFLPPFLGGIFQKRIENLKYDNIGIFEEGVKGLDNISPLHCLNH